MTAPANPPGRKALAYRAGTYGTFMRAMTERLNRDLPALTTRALADPSVALLDGWAIVADVLTFYQERIANESYVRTATDKASLAQLANLTGYPVRPGVAAGVYLAYTLEKNGRVTLPPGSKAQSVPGPGETTHTFETSSALDARAEWNVLGLRSTQPQEPAGTDPFYLQGVSTNLKPNDVLLFVRGSAAADGELPEHRFARVAAVEPQPAQGRTKITLQGAGLRWNGAAATPPVDDGTGDASAARKPAAPPPSLVDRIAAVKDSLLTAPSKPPLSPQRLRRTVAQSIGPDLDLTPQLFGALYPGARSQVYAALANAPSAAAPAVDVYAFRVHAAPYGHNAPTPPPVASSPQTPPSDVRAERNPQALILETLQAFIERAGTGAAQGADWPLALLDTDARTLSLDARYDRIAPGSFVAVRTFPADEPVLYRVTDTRERSRRDYGIAATSTVLTLNAPYFTAPSADPLLATLRDVDVFAQSEPLVLADVPIGGEIPADPNAGPTVLELDGLYDGLTPGRWAIVAGTRTDLAGVAGGELVMILSVVHRSNPALPGDALRTFITLSTSLAYRYERAGLTVWGNVVHATHGETRTETIGSGDAGQARQRFALKAKPLTFTSSPTQTGTQSTLSIAVNGVRWTQTDDASALGPTDRAYVSATSDDGTTVTFGDGVHGARLPSGAENVVATYRTGLGSGGNVGADKITLLMTRPLGVKAVTNPLPASGGADAESREDVRRNLSTALLALDRLVTLDDYATFARTFAGVAKADVALLGSGPGSTVAITLAGPANTFVDPAGDLARNLGTALVQLGDPRQAFAIAGAGSVLLFIGASIDPAPDALWETVEPAIRAALAATFGFAARDFGRPAYKSEALAAIAAVDGVVDVSIDLFTGVAALTDRALDRLGRSGDVAVVDDAVVPLPARRNGATIEPAQLVTLDPRIHDTILLRNNADGATP